MQIYSLQSFSGRNVFNHKPVIKMVIDIGNYYKMYTKNMDSFNEILLSLFPGLNRHYCSTGHEGGFVERLKEGTLIGHVIEHLILELQSMMGYDVYYGKTRIAGNPSVYYIVYEYMEEQCAIECGRAAVKIAGMIAASGKNIEIGAIIENLRKITIECGLGPSTKAIVDEALKRGIPVIRLSNDSLIRLGCGRFSRLIEGTLTDKTSCISVDIAGNKHLTKQMLHDNRIPVPYGGIAFTGQSAVEIAADVGYPVVIKPYDANQGKGVSVNISNEAQVRTAYNEALRFSKAAIIEKYIKGNDYRVLVVGGRVSAVSERRPPAVTGDGGSTVEELVSLENKNPMRGEDHEKPLTRIKLDGISKQILSERGLDKDYIPLPGEVVNLRNNGNISTGGTAKSCTERIHPFNSNIAVKAAKILGLDIAGIDITAEDISVPIDGCNGAVIEVNAAPGIRMHLSPSEGMPDNVAIDIIDMLFPKGMPHSVPIISLTGTNGKTTTTRLVKHILTLMGWKTGMTSTSGIYIGEECILKGDNTGPVSARMVLSNKEIDVAVLETARGGIVRKGLGYDLADVGVVINISEDHIGLDGVNTIEDLAHVKALVIESIKPEGYAVLNADDKMAGYLMERVRSNVILFSRDKYNSILTEHIEAGGKAVYLENKTIYIFNGKKSIPLIDVEEIPITLGGAAECNIENSLAAISALHAINILPGIIKKGLKSFMPDVISNPGRFNIFDMGKFKVMLDYGHNISSYNAVIKFAQKMDAKRLVGVIGMPGDRIDASIAEVGKICGRIFSKIYIKEDNDLRGRKPGEAADILFDAAIKNGIGKRNIEIIYSELKALETAITEACPGDLIIMFYEEFEPAVELTLKFKEELEKSENRKKLFEEISAG